MECVLCERIAVLEHRPDDPYLVAELGTGWVVLAQNQYYEGTTEFISKICVAELFELPTGIGAEYMREMTMVAEAVARAFQPSKLNYELLGNTVRHLHWRLFPRHAGDPLWQRPVWENPRFQETLSNDDALPLPERRESMREVLASTIAEFQNRQKPYGRRSTDSVRAPGTPQPKTANGSGEHPAPTITLNAPGPRSKLFRKR